MKKLTLLLLACFAMFFVSNAQTAEEVIDLYFETVGGEEKFAALTATKAICNAKAQGMEIPVTMVSALPNKTRMDMTFQGKEMTQMAFDGQTAWGVNFMTMEAEAMDAETSMVIKAQTDFPDAFVNYKEKGYTVEITGSEEVEGVDCHVIKMTRKPIIIEEKEVENSTLFYMDKENGILIKQTDLGLNGPQKGMTIETYYSDYEEVDGMYFAFTIEQKIDGNTSFGVSISELILNPELPEDYFTMPK
jgi:hypothetical protein